MKKMLLFSLAVIGLSFLAVSVAFALPSNQGLDKAKTVSPAIDEISGEVVAPPPAQLPESELTKVVFIRRAPGTAALCNNNNICDPRENWKSCPSDCTKGGGGGDDEPKPVTCYGFLSGAKPHWNWLENYYVDDPGLGTSAASAISTWNAATSATIFGSPLSGAGSWGTYDLKNSIVYGDYPDGDVIGVTVIWYQGKNIYEYDILFDQDYLPGDGSVDLDTVVLHEFGHGAGLDDLYDAACTSEVMYGVYDTVDLDLGPGDTTGIQTLYGI